MQRSWQCLVALAAIGLLATAASGQTPTGSIAGRVTSGDQPLGGATVIVTSENLQGTRRATTSANGDYLLTPLPPGDYTVAFQAQGFQTANKTAHVAAGT